MSSTYGLREVEPSVFDFGYGEAGDDRPDTPSIAVASMADRWELLHDLWGGTPVMRASSKWLTQEDKESDVAFANRRKRSVCFGAFRETLLRLSASPFRRPVTIHGEDIPDWVTDLERNVNRAGRDLTQFAHEVFFSGWFYGHGVIMGEAPESSQVRGQGAGDSRNMAYLVDIPASRILGWDVDYDRAGNEVVVELRVLEYATQRVGTFREKRVKRVRHYKQPLRDRSTVTNEGDGITGGGSVQIWTDATGTGGGSWEAGEILPYTLEGPNGGLPIFPAYVNYVGPLQSEPPLEDLAWHNQMHWESQSDQRNILRFVRVATLLAKGFSEEEVQNIVFGANRVVPLMDTTGSLDYVEHSGAGAEAGFKDLDRIEAMMERLGLQPLLRDSAKVTATGQQINANGSNSLLEQSVKALENALNDAFRWLASVRGEELEDDFRISAFGQFDIPTIGGQNKQEILMRSAQAGLLPVRAYLEELRRDGFIGSHTDVDSLIEELESQRQTEMVGLGSVGIDDE